MKFRSEKLDMELDQLKNYVIDAYCKLKIYYNDGMGSVQEYGSFRAKCAEANSLYKMASELGIDDQIVDPPEIDEEWTFWDGVEGVQYMKGKDSYGYDEDDELIEELGELPDSMEDEEQEDEDY